MNGSSTNPPYSGAISSSVSAAPLQYLPPASPAGNSSVDISRYGTMEIGIAVLSLILTAVVGYFSALMAVKSDIADGRMAVSVIDSNVKHLTGDLRGAEDDLKKVVSLSRDVAVIEVRLNDLQKSVDRIEAVNDSGREREMRK